ncbi:SDR family NAD(P)-dependent oxidoreductase [Haloferula sp.]|uniref:SDR family NAD(P)-dependent oxidoreductase n=1 Tax=Haloferula sp. TaxID=2497595 RepID=UPI003C783B32
MSKNQSTILVTGCAGFIGAATAGLLLEQGQKVIGLDNVNDYYDVRVKRSRLAILSGNPDFEFHEIDLEDRAAIEALFETHDISAVINLAARAGVRASIVDPFVYVSTNTMGTLHLLDAMRKREIKTFIMASTSSLYADVPMPFEETANVARPVSPYAASKLGAEALAHSYAHLYGMNVAILRYFTVFGPAGRPDMSPFRFTEWVRRGEPIQLYGDGTQTRDFTFVDDIASGTVAALGIKGYEIINLGGGNAPLSINQMIESIGTELGIEPKVSYLEVNRADMKDTSANVAKANRILGWTPKVSPFEGFKRTVEWHKKNADWLDSVDL